MRKITVAAALVVLGVLIFSQSYAQTESPRDIPVDAFGSLPKNSQVRLSPNGKYFSIVSYIKGTRYVIVTPVGGKPIMAIPPYKNMVIDWADWANNNTLLIEMSGQKEAYSAFGKITVGRMISYNIDTKKAKDMQKPASGRGGLERHTYTADYSEMVDWLRDDPDHILLAIDEDGSDQANEVRRVDVESGNYTLEMDFSEAASSWVTDQQQTIRLGIGMERKNRSATGERKVYWYRNPETNDFDKHEISPGEQFFVGGFFEDPRYAYVLKPNDAGHLALYKFDMIKWEPEETIYEPENGNVDNVIVDRYSEKPIGYAYTEGTSKVHYFDEDFAHIQKLMAKALPGSEITISSYNQSRNLFVIHATSDIEPGAYYLFERDKMNLVFMEAAFKDLDPRLMSHMKRVSYKARDGLEIPAYLTIPIGSDGKNLPTVILPHGGPESRDYWGYDFIVQFLASRGYAVLQPEFRGSGGFSKEFAEAGHKEWGLKMQDDVTDGAKWMIAQGIADPNRMCIMGWSYGGYVSLTATFTTPDLFKCAISINGVSDLPAVMYQDSNFIGSSYWKRSIGDPGEDKDKLKRTSAIYNVDKIKIPVLLIANRNDTTVDYKQSKSFYEKMKDAGKTVKYKEIEEGEHSALAGTGRITILKNAGEFLAKYIGH